MATKHVVVCDNCEKEEPMPDRIEGRFPDGWFLLTQVRHDGSIRVGGDLIHLCSWACVGTYGRERQ